MNYQDYEKCNRVIIGFTQCVMYISNINDSNIDLPNTVFTCIMKPTIEFHDYVHRALQAHAHCPEYLIYAIALLNRYEYHGNLITSYNAHKLFASAYTISVMLLNDYSYSYEVYSQIMGVPCQELVRMVLEFLKLLKWETFITDIELNSIFYTFDNMHNIIK